MSGHRKFVFVISVSVLVVSILTGWLLTRFPEGPSLELTEELRPARAEYFFRMLRDPATNHVPPGIRARELEAARRLPKREIAGGHGPFFDWTEMGPDVLAGRTRAIAIDVRDNQTILAGGVSGGVWRSTNAGTSWKLTSDFLGVTSIAQDPRPGHEDTWYFSTGELVGSTGTEFGVSPFYGNGIYKSVDGGESWSLLPTTVSDATSYDSPFNFTWRIRVSPTTGSVFVTGNGFAIYRSIDGGESFEKVLGEGESEHIDLAVNSRGDILAVLSSSQKYTGEMGPGGLFASKDDGASWTRIPTPLLDSTLHSRSVLAFAPSNPDAAYVISEVDLDQPLAIHKIDLESMSADDRSANVPVLNGNFLRTYGSYTMAVAVKPDDEEFVLIAGIEMWRTRDGFATPRVDDPDANVSSQAASDRCVDIHELVFDRNEPTRLWIGCDQGVWTSADVVQSKPVFRSLNSGYNVSQFYAAAMSDEPGDPRIVGGMQDWGSVAFEAPTFASLIGVGDGGYAYLGRRFAYSSLQYGRVYRHDISDNGGVFGRREIASGLSSVLFINPFVVDPVAEKVMYYPSFNELWRNRSIESNFADQNWKLVDGAGLPEQYFITALAASTEPANILYYAGYHPEKPPVVYRLAHADTANGGPIDVSIPEAAAGAYPSAVAVNPANADEIMVVLSNYNIVGLYHSADGGMSYTAVEGNLEGTPDLPGPSIRSATILPLETGTVYAVGTSTGVYSTDDLQDAGTTWLKEGDAVVGDAVVAHLTSRPSDGRLLAATHGRGIFVGDRNSAPVAIEDETFDGGSAQASLGDDLPGSFVTDLSVFPNPTSGTANLRFTLAEPASVRMSVFDLAGRRIQQLESARALPPGVQTIPVALDGLVSGSYFVKIDAAAERSTRPGPHSTTRRVVKK